MPPKKIKQTEALLKNSQQNKKIAELQSNILIKKGKSDINEIYNDELKKVVDLNETVSVSINKPVPKPPPVVKPIKEISNKGKKASGNLSKYREQVKEALELKKKLDSQKQLSYDEDEDDDDDEEIEFKAIPPIIEPVPVPQISIPKQIDRVLLMPVSEPKQLFDLETIHKELQDMKLKNKEIEDRFLYRKSCIDISNMRRNMSIKF
jgi:hypothetical protein